MNKFYLSIFDLGCWYHIVFLLLLPVAESAAISISIILFPLRDFAGEYPWVSIAIKKR